MWSTQVRVRIFSVRCVSQCLVCVDTWVCMYLSTLLTTIMHSFRSFKQVLVTLLLLQCWQTVLSWYVTIQELLHEVIVCILVNVTFHCILQERERTAGCHIVHTNCTFIQCCRWKVGRRCKPMQWFKDRLVLMGECSFLPSCCTTVVSCLSSLLQRNSYTSWNDSVTRQQLRWLGYVGGKCFWASWWASCSAQSNALESIRNSK